MDEASSSLVELETLPARSLPGKLDEVRHLGLFKVSLVSNRSDSSLTSLVVVLAHDLGMNALGCFESFMNYCRSNPKACPQLLSLSQIYLDAPGHEEGGDPVAETTPWPTVESLSNSIEVVEAHYQLQRVVGFGVGAGATLLLHHALSHPSRYSGLILVSPSFSSSGYLESINLRGGINYMWYAGALTEWVRYWLMHRWFGVETPESNRLLRDKFLEILERIPSVNVARYLHSYVMRPNLGRNLETLRTRILVLAGRDSAGYADIVEHMSSMGSSHSTLIDYVEVGSLVLEERPGEAAGAISLFFQGLGVV